MGLITDYKPYESFLASGHAFFEAPGVMSSMEFDDAVVVYKRYVNSQLHDEAMGFKLNDLGACVRKLDVEGARALFKEIVSAALV
ncbi:MAG: hypothetical protein B0D96_08045 [Candidatus Sedimenticola endophacoides]|uniref:Uncharacterized protein n=1 Tax=Candidatus Sedimenticola endophacoides TaxID=2548426 RepID=A0A657PVX9_9GAMM|nr:MAG: hypothetical protein B0D94_11695 [Candidatus Sedimenticola endophacoides]OQX34942.1 MAG: hypothetical protein B0D96_08045 [Candidatus Sedimenticola endophacoides]OQX40520.1 MAG: hypothetical protein B0D89_07385 [Candidatus Sedimenticola endophacoides]OQX45693.1 MAG: hypothetical protein B0D86_03100 [Candidatus Sedimenticola endophacoides]OQX47158.1 MAG: hypothetical protein B0D85_02085 [Candidatus Sedimenticola endophacoides]